MWSWQPSPRRKAVKRTIAAIVEVGGLGSSPRGTYEKFCRYDYERFVVGRKKWIVTGHRHQSCASLEVRDYASGFGFRLVNQSSWFSPECAGFRLPRRPVWPRLRYIYSTSSQTWSLLRCGSSQNRTFRLVNLLRLSPCERVSIGVSNRAPDSERTRQQGPIRAAFLP